jgi:HEAT repeat protein
MTTTSVFRVSVVCVTALVASIQLKNWAAAGAVDADVTAAIEQLSSPQEETRARAAIGLGDIGQTALPAYDALFSLALSNDLPKVRKAAASALGKITKERAVDEFIEKLKANSPAVIREHAADALMVSELRSPKAVAPLVEALRDESERVRRRAGIALQFYHDEKLEGMLILALGNSHDKAREWAPWLLGRMKSRAAIAPLHALLSDNDAAFRKSVIAALRDIKSRESIAPLIVAATQDKDDDVRSRAIHCLGELDDGSASRTLLGLISDNNPEIRVCAASALGRLGVREAKGPLRKMLGADANREALAAMMALCQLRDEQAIPLIVKRIKELQGQQIELIGRFTDSLVELGAEKELLLLSKHDDNNIKTAANAALRKVEAGRKSPRDEIQTTKAWLHALMDKETDISAVLPYLSAEFNADGRLIAKAEDIRQLMLRMRNTNPDCSVAADHFQRLDQLQITKYMAHSKHSRKYELSREKIRSMVLFELTTTFAGEKNVDGVFIGFDSHMKIVSWFD